MYIFLSIIVVLIIIVLFFLYAQKTAETFEVNEANLYVSANNVINQYLNQVKNSKALRQQIRAVLRLDDYEKTQICNLNYNKIMNIIRNHHVESEEERKILKQLEEYIRVLHNNLCAGGKFHARRFMVALNRTLGASRYRTGIVSLIPFVLTGKSLPNDAYNLQNDEVVRLSESLGELLNKMKSQHCSKSELSKIKQLLKSNLRNICMIDIQQYDIPEQDPATQRLLQDIKSILLEFQQKVCAGNMVNDEELDKVVDEILSKLCQFDYRRLKNRSFFMYLLDLFATNVKAAPPMPHINIPKKSARQNCTFNWECKSNNCINGQCHTEYQPRLYHKRAENAVLLTSDLLS